MKGLNLPCLSDCRPLVVSAYADDINVFIKDNEDMLTLEQGLQLFSKAAPAKVNWTKSEACLIGQWGTKETLVLPGLKWRTGGLKILL